MRGQTVVYVILVGVILGMVSNSLEHKQPSEQQSCDDNEDKVDNPTARLKHTLSCSCSVTEEPAPTAPVGTVFTRWGRTVCPPNATLVYRGVMGGTHSTYAGAGIEYLCLTDKPEWGKKGTSSFSYIAGVEFKSGDELFDKDNAEKLIHHDAVCAVCKSAKNVQVMIPGRQSCMEGWTQEYYGYLMTSYDTTGEAKNYVCMDHAPEVDKAGYENKGGATLYPVAAACGSLPCPGYIQNERLTCVVCSQ